MIFIAKGTAKMARTTRDKDGNILEHKPASFTTDDTGHSVVVGEFAPETMQIKGPVKNLYGDWDAARYLQKVMELLQPARKTNIPPLREIVKAATSDGDCPFIDYCPNEYCGDCCVREWVDEED